MKRFVFRYVWALLVCGMLLIMATRVEAGSGSNVQSQPLQGVVLGISDGGPITEPRLAVLPHEEIVLQAYWTPADESFPVTSYWISPGRSIAYQSTLNIQKGWARTWMFYRGPRPMATGQWKTVIKAGQQTLGSCSFAVRSDPGEVPALQAQRAYDRLALEKEEARGLGQTLFDRLQNTSPSGRALEGLLPEWLGSRPLQVAVALYESGERTGFALGSGQDLQQALNSVLDTLKTISFNQETTRLKLSVLHQPFAIPNTPYLLNLYLQGNRGFAVRTGSGRHLLLPQTILEQGIQTGQGVLDGLQKLSGLSDKKLKDQDTEIETFPVQEFVYDPSSGECSSFCSGRSMRRLADIGFEDIEETIDLAVAWFLKNQESDGSFLYSYDPLTNEVPAEDWCLRQLNAVFVLSQIAAAQGAQTGLESGLDRALHLYAGSVEQEQQRAFFSWEQPRKDSSLAATAFLLAALSNRSDGERQLDLEPLAEAIFSLQENSGRFQTDFVRKERTIDQLYYPGETMLSLMEYYRASEDVRSVDALAGAYHWYTDYWQDSKQGPFVPWQVRAYARFFELTGNPKYKEFCFELQDWLLDTYPPLSLEQNKAKAGALTRALASTGVYTEGLVRAYALARQAGDEERMKRYGRALAGCVRYLLGLQFRPEDVFWLQNPDRVIGALATKPLHNDLRLDYTYHAISALHLLTTSFDPEVWGEIKSLHR